MMGRRIVPALIVVGLLDLPAHNPCVAQRRKGETITFDPVEHRFTFPMPAHRPAYSPGDRASLTLLHYDPQLASERYLLFYGQLTELGNTWAFTPSRVVIRQ